MGKGDHCAVFGCNNDRRYVEKQFVCPHVGQLRFFSPRNAKDKTKWQKLINRKDFKVTGSTKVCSNHFASGYRCKECPDPTLYMKGYETKNLKKRSAPKQRGDVLPRIHKKRKITEESDILCNKTNHYEVEDSFYTSEPIIHEECLTEQGNSSTNIEPVTIKSEQQSDVSDKDDSLLFEDDEKECFCDGDLNALKRKLFIQQATDPKKCYQYTGLSNEKLDLVFGLIEVKARSLRYWRGSIDTPPSQAVKRGHVPRLLTSYEEFVLTLVRTRKGFDIAFLADTFAISTSQVSRIYNTWVIFLSNELSFLVPWPSKAEIQAKLPKRFKKFKNLRIIIDCAEFFIQKPKIPESQKVTWSSYKHWNTAKLLVGITPTGVISFIPPLWTGSVSDKEIVRNSGLVNILEEGDAVMADKGFLVRDLLVMKKVSLISPAYCRGPRLSSRGVTHTRRVASLRSHVERMILKLKQFRILSGVIPLTMKPMLDNIIFVCAALCNLAKRPIK